MGIIIDGGACVGEWTSHIYNKRDTFYCFEPLGSNFASLQRWAHDKPNVTLVQAALGGFNGTAPLWRGQHNGAGAYWGGTIVDDKYTDCEPDEVVQVVKLSDYWKEHINQLVGILKMNIEGAEYDVLEDLLDAGIVNQFATIRYQDHGVRGAKVIPSCRDKAYEVFPRFEAEFKGLLQFIVGSVHGVTLEIPEYLR
ncbi:MAG: FkbM family methyltransferase [Candidatus Thorarchaeota archaeon]|jgi:FkbM family methyltransferase